jgi:hypothetical protein
MKLVISIDVEEEGLFSGRYSRTPPGVTNVEALERLAFIPQDFGFPLTLLATYQVARDPAACRVLARWRDLFGAEIGAHLHHWNTPPFADLSDPEPVASEKLPRALLREKFASLVSQIRTGLAVTPRSFRMGRFDAGSQVFSLLPEFGLEVDSSVAPLTRKNPDPRFFLAPADPFYLDDLGPEGQPLLEVPITLVPVVAGTPELIDRLAALAPPAWGARLRSLFRFGGVNGVQPAMFPLASLKLAASLHRRRGGRVLTMYFHSSELKPGTNPLFTTEAAVGRFVDKIRTFLTWLVKTGPVEGTTLTALGEDWRRVRRPDQTGAAGGEGTGPAGAAPASAS